MGLPLRRLLTVLPALCWIGLAPSPVLAAGENAVAAARDAGTWDLSYEKGNRRCRLFLRSEPQGDHFAVAMPAGCRKAFLALTSVTAWAPGEGEHIQFKTEAGATVLDFAPDGTASLSATTGENEVYQLMPINPAMQDLLRAAGRPDAVAATVPAQGGHVVLVEKAAARAKGAVAKVEPPPPALPATTVAEVAGNYAVLRQDRDTGCMVTLEVQARAKADLRAKLAPACRDQGIVIFDPVGWQLFHGNELVLTAKKGHTTALGRRDEKTWANAPPRGAALVLKRL